MHDHDPNLRNDLSDPDGNFQSALELHDLDLGHPHQQVSVVDLTRDGFVGMLERDLGSGSDAMWEPDAALAHKLDSDIEHHDLAVALHRLQLAYDRYVNPLGENAGTAGGRMVNLARRALI